MPLRYLKHARKKVGLAQMTPKPSPFWGHALALGSLLYGLSTSLSYWKKSQHVVHFSLVNLGKKRFEKKPANPSVIFQVSGLDSVSTWLPLVEDWLPEVAILICDRVSETGKAMRPRFG